MLTKNHLLTDVRRQGPYGRYWYWGYIKSVIACRFTIFYHSGRRQLLVTGW